MKIKDYKFEYKHIEGSKWLAIIIRPDGVKFAGHIQHPRQQPNVSVNEHLFNAFMDPEGIKQFWIELEENISYWVIKEPNTDISSKKESEPSVPPIIDTTK